MRLTFKPCNHSYQRLSTKKNLWIFDRVLKKREKWKGKSFPLFFSLEITHTFLATKQSEYIRVQARFLHQNQPGPSLHPAPGTAELLSHSLLSSLHIPIQPASEANQNPNLYPKQQILINFAHLYKKKSSATSRWPSGPQRCHPPQEHAALANRKVNHQKPQHSLESFAAKPRRQ